MLSEVWSVVRGHRTRLLSPEHLTVALPVEDEPETLSELSGAPDYEGQPISGFSCILTYRDGGGRRSQRRITCQRLDLAGAQHYVVAFCHEREARRQFRLDRIEALVDLHTGEMIERPAEFLMAFAVDRKQTSGLGWGLSPRMRADLVAGLNALIFLGRCDRDWHPLEREALEAFVCSFWLRNELIEDVPLDDILAHAERLSPDAETFFISLNRCASRPQLTRLIRQHLGQMIDADGSVAPEEFHWGAAADEFFLALIN